jgi:glycosyltransferase involved in cell wall biosynthesis
MKVLMTADTVGGVFTYASDLASALDAEVVLATIGPRRASRHHRDLRLEWMEDPWDDVAAAEDWLLELEERERPAVVHLNGYAHGAAPFRAPKLVAGHSCVLSWWRAVHGCEAPPAWDRYRDAVRAGIEGADAVIAPTAWMLDQLEALYGPLPARSRVVHNGSAAPRADGPKERFVLGAGRFWDDAKNLAALDEAAAGLDAPVLLAGDTGGRAPRYARTIGPLAPAALAGFRERAAVFAAPARYEPFGLAILEAARAGCSLVLGDIPPLRELWEGAARFVDPADPEALRAALEEALAEPRPAADRAARYSLAAMADGHRAVYEELAAGRVAA